MKKVIFIAPGNKSQYQNLIKKIEKKDYKVFFIGIDWNYKTPTKWFNEALEKVCNIQIHKNTTILTGYSVGAFVSLVILTQIRFRKCIVFSPSPIFKESLRFLNKRAIKQLGKKRVQESKQYFNLAHLGGKIKTPVKIYLGEKEDMIMHKNAMLIKNKIPKTKLGVIQDKDHYNILKDVNLDYSVFFR